MVKVTTQDVINLEKDRDEARMLAKIMFNILKQFPCSLDEFDSRLAIEDLPDWLID